MYFFNLFSASSLPYLSGRIISVTHLVCNTYYLILMNIYDQKTLPHISRFNLTNRKTQPYEHYTKSNKTLKCADILLLLVHFFKIYPFN